VCQYVGINKDLQGILKWLELPAIAISAQQSQIDYIYRINPTQGRNEP
jgi:hypothetical protein